jgi:nucleotide-binding universal stress UspA family protein
LVVDQESLLLLPFSELETSWGCWGESESLVKNVQLRKLFLIGLREKVIFLIMFNSCLICTDFNDGLHRLVKFVPDLALSGLRRIIFFHSVPLWEEGEVPRIDEEKIQAAKQRLSQALEQVPEGVEVKIEVLSGKPLETIPRILQANSIDVIITGTPIRSLLQEKFFGSTSVGLAKQTAQPLMIIRPQLISTYTEEELSLRCQHLWRYLLIPYNDSPSAHYLLEQIKHYAQNRPENSCQKCLLIWVIDDITRQGMLAKYRVEEAQQKLKTVKAQLEELGIEVHTEVKTGNPLQQILETALVFDISALAVATDYRNTLLQWTIPSFANDLLRRSWFPVLLFSPKN